MLKLKSIEGIGILDKERLVMQVEAKTNDTNELNLGRYAIFACKFGDNGLPYSGKFLAGYWFNTKALAPGDYIILYTKYGLRAEKKLTNGNTSHFFYWGLGETLWEGEYRPLLVQTGRWSFIEEQEFTVEPQQKAASGTDDDIPF